MIAMIGRRLLAMVGLLVLLTAAVFVLQHNSPTDPAHAFLGANATPAAVAHERHVLGYDRPIVDQYLRYVDGLLHGNFQASLRTHRSVSTDLGQYLPATAELALASLILALILGGLLGLTTALRVVGSGLLRIFMTTAGSTPPFLLGLAGILLFYSKLGWLPAYGRTDLTNPPNGPTGLLTIDTLVRGNVPGFFNALNHMVLPATCIALLPAVAIGRVLRSSLIDTLEMDYIRTARSKGLSEGAILVRHALRNSVGPALSMTGLQVGGMFAGVVIIETIFAWPGIGLYTSQSIVHADFPAIAGVTVVLGIGYVLINLIVDILQIVADRRLAL